MRIAVLASALFVLVNCQSTYQRATNDPAPSDTRGPEPIEALPAIGTQIPILPPGNARQLAQDHCLACHASEMIQQQRLTDAQWKAELDKMQRWGAEIRDEDKKALATYLVTHFGPDNDRFRPLVASP